jgi:glycolate oxidase FAD binding subunit
MMETAASSLVGPDAVRAGALVDAVEGVVPRIVVEPSTVSHVSALVEWASRERLAVLARGSGTKLGWGPAPRRLDVLLSTAKLNAVVAHRHGDLTATIQAGATLGEVNRLLSQHRQWLPLDPPSAERATIGGLVATNDSGPRRHRYGTPRDLIIGVEFVRSDGRLAKGGGIVVKNVAGYDLPRLMTGSFGALGVVVSATFKLYPIPAASATLVVTVGDAGNDLQAPERLNALVAGILSSHLTPTALEFATHPLRLLIRFESIEASVTQQCETAGKLVADCRLEGTAIRGAEEAAVWNERAVFAADRRGALLKVSIVPTELAATLSLLDRLAGKDGYAAAGRAGGAVFLVNVLGDLSTQRRVIEGLREAQPRGRGSAVVVHGSPELKTAVDVWGPIGDALPLMRAVKSEFDATGLFSPGRGPGGL